MQQFPDLAPQYQFDPQGAVKRAFPEAQKPKIVFAPNGQAVDMNQVQPGQNFAKQPDWKDPEYQAFQMGRAKASAPVVNVAYDKSMAGALGEGTAGVLKSGRDKAESAVESIKQGHQILQTLDSGPSYTGPGATPKYQAEIKTGNGYLPVFFQYYGGALLAAICLAFLKQKLDSFRWWKILASVVAIAISMMFVVNLKLNIYSIEKLNTIWYYSRSVLEQSLQRGLFDHIPPNIASFIPRSI